MVVIGMNLVGQRLSGILRDRDVLSASLLRLLASRFDPGSCWSFCQSPIPGGGGDRHYYGDALRRCHFYPAESYGGNTEFPSKSVFLSSLFCLVTIPLISLLL